MIERCEPTLQTREELVEQVENAKMRLALYDLQQEDIESIPQEEHPFSAGRTQQARQRIAHAARAKKKDCISVRRLLRAACIVLLCAYLTTTVAVAISPTLRRSFADLLVTFDEEYAHLGMVEKDGQDRAPDGWQGDYFPAWIPEDYALSRLADTNAFGMFTAEFINSLGSYLYFSEVQDFGTYKYATEGADISQIFIHDIPAILITSGERNKIVWVEYDKGLSVEYDGDAEIAVQIAKSVKRIR